MSKLTFMVLVPIWIGILFNLLMTVFNFACLGQSHNKFVHWYLGNGGIIIMVSVWSALLIWSAANYFVYR